MFPKSDISKQLVLGETLSRWASQQPNKEALVFKNRRFTYKQLADRVNRLAAGLADLGIGKNDKVGLIFMNCNEIVECYFAITKLGAVAVPCNFRFKGQEYVYQLKQSDCQALIFSEVFSDVITSIQADLPEVEHYICVGKNCRFESFSYEQLLQKSSADAPMVYVDDDDPAFIMYTSGTTGKAKGAVLTHKNEIMSAISFSRHYPATNNLLIAFPLFHAAGMFYLIYGIFYGMTIIIQEDPKPEMVMETIVNEKIQLVGLVPSLWNWIVNHPQIDKYDFSSLRIGITGAAPISATVKRRIVECFPKIQFVEAFGMTETAAMGTFAAHEDYLIKHGTIGRPVNNLDIRIVDDNGNDIPAGQVGEIIYRGPVVMKEYYKNQEATAEAFKGGWFHGGDLVSRDEDGLIFIMGRKKDMIISGGENIYPVEVEDLLAAHPKILEAAVVGVPDAEWGENVKAFVVRKPGEKLTKKEVIKYCRTSMASYKKPKLIEFIDILPRTATGKVLKSKLRKQATHSEEAANSS